MGNQKFASNFQIGVKIEHKKVQKELGAKLGIHLVQRNV